LSVSSARLEVSTADCGIELSDLSHINCASLWRSMAMIDLKLNLIRHGRLLGSKSILLINLIQFHPGRSLLVVARREWNVWKESGFQLGRVSLTHRTLALCHIGCSGTMVRGSAQASEKAESNDIHSLHFGLQWTRRQRDKPYQMSPFSGLENVATNVSANILASGGAPTQG
jgi:hypothetical protein